MKKWIPNVFYPFEYEALSFYLERQARKGWILTEVSPTGFWFHKEEPKELRYCVDIPHVRRKQGGKTEYLTDYYQMCEEAGWYFVGSNMVCHIFVAQDPYVAPLHTDQTTQYEAIQSDLRPRMFAALLGMVILAALRFREIPAWGSVPAWMRACAFLMIVIVYVGQIEMFIGYLSWKKRQEEILRMETKEKELSLWPMRSRAFLYAIAIVLLIVAMIPLVMKVGGEIEGLAFWDKAWNVVGNPVTMILVYHLCARIMTRILWKKGYDDKSGHAIGVAVGFVVMVLMLGLCYEMQEITARKEKGQEYVHDMEKVDQIPLTEVDLGLTARYDSAYHTEEDEECALGQYTVMLDTGGYLKYDYYRYRQEQEAYDVWQLLHRRYEGYVEQYHGNGTLYHYEWLEQDLSALATEQAMVVQKLDEDSSYVLYQYMIQKGNIYWSINYLSEEPFTQQQLQAIAEKLPQ